MSGAKLAALKMASLNVADREWMLQRLSEQERQQVEPAIAAVLRLQSKEIENIVRDNRAIFQAYTRSEGNEKKSDLKVANVDAIRVASISRLEGILDELDPVSLALVLNSHDWPWLTVYLNRKGVNTKNQLATVLEHAKGKVSTHFLGLIIEKIAQRLQPEPLPLSNKSRFETLLLDGYVDSLGQNAGPISRGRRGAST